jgi:hypothetical protein
VKVTAAATAAGLREGFVTADGLRIRHMDAEEIPGFGAALQKPANMTSALACQSGAMLPLPALRGEGWGEGPLVAAQVMEVGPSPGTRTCARLATSPRKRGEMIVSLKPEA